MMEDIIILVCVAFIVYGLVSFIGDMSVYNDDVKAQTGKKLYTR